MVLPFVRSRPMSTTAVPVPPVLATLIGRLAAAVPGRARATFTELLIGAAVTRGGHVTDAILAVGPSRSWTTYYWLLERGRWSWLAVWRALLGVLEGRRIHGRSATGQAKRIWTSLPSSLSSAWSGVRKPRHLRGVRLWPRTISCSSASPSASRSRSRGRSRRSRPFAFSTAPFRQDA